MLDALRVYRESDRKGMPTADEVKDMTDLMKQQSYPFARCLRDLLRASDESALVEAQERAATKRRKLWSCFESEIRVKQGIEISEETFAKAAAEFLGLSTIQAQKNGIEGVDYCFGADKFILGDIETPSYSLSDCTLADATMWASRFDVIAIALMNMETDWVQTLLEESSEVEDTDLLPKNDWKTPQYEHTLTVIEKLKAGLKKFHVIDIEEFVDDILHFYNGIGVSELSTSPEEMLKNISDFIEGFVDEPLQVWPEYIRNHRWVPKRELVLVSIGINNNTDDEFELVEFTDERSDEIGSELNALPEDLRMALLKIAAERIYAEEVKEFNTAGEVS